MILKGYKDPKTNVPEGKYPEQWSAWDRAYPPEWREYNLPKVPEWFNPTEFLLDKNVERNPSKVALILDDAKYTYEKILRLVNRAANALTKRGLDSDDRILLFSPDSVEAFATWLGALRAGICPVWVSPLFKTHELLYFILDAGAKFLLIDEEQLEKLNEIKGELAPTLHIIIRGEGEGDWRSFDEFVGGAVEEFTPVKKHRDDICYFYYSGGTTGSPKGIVHLTADFVLVPDRHIMFMEWTRDDVHYATSSKFHTHGLWPGLLLPLYNGATAIASSKRLTADLVVETIEKHEPTVLTTVPTVLKWLVTYPEEKGKRPNLGCLRMVTSAAEKIPLPIHQKFKELYDIEVFDTIGSSEVTYEWMANRPKEHRMGSVGKPIFGVDVVVVDPETLDIITEPNREGELWVRSRTGLLFYWRKYEKSREVIVHDLVRTGDSLYFDEDGFFWYVGRIDDLFKVHGLWVSPQDVEDILLKHPTIKDAAVIPKRNPEDGLTYPKAFVILKPGYRLTDAIVNELKEMVRKEVGGYKAPKWVEEVEEMPRTAYHKISRLILRLREEEREKTK